MSKDSFYRNNFVDVLRKYSTTVPSQGNLFIEHHDDTTEDLYIERSVYKEITDYIKQKPKDSIFLTGNAGDGKTTICKELVKKGLFQENDVVEDFSALIKTDRINLLKEVALKKKRKVVACNEGALRAAIDDMIKNQDNEDLTCWGNWLKKEVIIDSAYDSERNQIKHVNVRNLNQKNNSSDAILLLKKMVVPSNWSACEKCLKVDNCPIKLNSDSLQNNEVYESIKNLYDFVHDRGDHVTIRDILVHLSYTITGGLSCEDVHKLKTKSTDNINKEKELVIVLRRLFSENFFGGNWKDQFQDKPLPIAFESLRQLSMGMHSNRKIDRRLTLDRDKNFDLKINRFIVNKTCTEYLNNLRDEIQVGDQTLSKKDSEYFYGKILPIFRRLDYFECQKNSDSISKISRYFKYESFKDKLKRLSHEKSSSNKILAKKVILALNRYQANSVSSQSDEILSIFANSCLHSAPDTKLVLSFKQLDFKRCLFFKRGGDSQQMDFYFNVRKILDIKLNIGLELYEYIMSIVNGINTPEMKRMFGSKIDVFLSSIQSEVRHNFKGEFDWDLVNHENKEIISFKDPGSES